MTSGLSSHVQTSCIGNLSRATCEASLKQHENCQADVQINFSIGQITDNQVHN